MKTLTRGTPFLCLVIAGLVAATLVTVSVSPALAHHAGVEWDREQVLELNGTIKEFQFMNPHTWIQIEVENGDGAIEEWSVEWGSPNTLSRRGIRPSTFPAGAEATVRINPMKSGDPAGGFVGAKLADGSIVGRWED